MRQLPWRSGGRSGEPRSTDWGFLRGQISISRANGRAPFVLEGENLDRQPRLSAVSSERHQPSLRSPDASATLRLGRTGASLRGSDLNSQRMDRGLVAGRMSSSVPPAPGFVRHRRISRTPRGREVRALIIGAPMAIGPASNFSTQESPSWSNYGWHIPKRQKA